jgi:hypothetical protein
MFELACTDIRSRVHLLSPGKVRAPTVCVSYLWVKVITAHVAGPGRNTP